MRSVIGLCGLIAAASWVGGTFAETAFDYAPDLTKSTFPPYPPMTNQDGSNITIANLRGTRLFGYDGCSKTQKDQINEAYDDLHTLLTDPAVYNSIDWNDVITTDLFGGPDQNGNYPITQARRDQIQRKVARSSARLLPLID